MRLPQAAESCSGVTLGRDNWLKNLDVSCLIFPERKMAKVVTLKHERGPEALHMLVCAWVWCPQHL